MKMSLEKFNIRHDITMAQVRMAQGNDPDRSINPLTALREVKDIPDIPIATKAAHLTKAIGRVMRGKMKGVAVMVTPEEKERRLGICRECKFWNEHGNIGMGECRHPQCGCTRFKHGLSTEKCPMALW